jgi:hypothetical protein
MEAWIIMSRNVRMKGRKRAPFKKGLFIGQIAGTFYFLSTLIFFWPEEELYLIKGLFQKIHFFVYSISFWAFVFAIFTAFLLSFMNWINRKNIFRLNEFFPSFFVILLFLLGYAIYYYYQYKTPPHYPSYLLNKGILLSVAGALLVSIFLSLVFVFVIKFSKVLFRFKKDKDRAPWFQKLEKLSVFSFLFFFLYFLFFPFYSHISTRLKKQNIKVANPRAFILGIDAATWNILAPLLKGKKLANINRLMKNSAYGYLDTYGEQLTPKVWTSIATGKTPEKHGIHSFADRSYNWRTKSLWEILSFKGEKIGVANWVCTYPTVPFNGFLFSAIQKDLPDQHYSRYEEDFDLSLEELFLPEEDIVNKGNQSAYIQSLDNELENLRRILSSCNNLSSYKLLCFYIYKIDPIQHFFWDDFLSDSEANRNVFGKCWDEIDKYIEIITEKLDKDTFFFVVSDHGSRPIRKREVFFHLEKILEALDYPSSEREDFVPHFSVVDEEFIEVPRETSQTDVEELQEFFNSVLFWPSQKPIFSHVKIMKLKEKRFVKVELSSPLKVHFDKEQKIKIKDDLYPLRKFTEPSGWSGRHRARGIIIANGPGISSRYLGSWLVDSPYIYLFRLLHGRIGILDKLYPFFRFFRIVDPITTLDITPTCLPLLGYPVASDMDGKDWSSWIAPQVVKNTEKIKSYGKSAFLDEKKTLGKEEIKRVREELRALGYIK